MTEIEELYELFYLTPVGLGRIDMNGNIEQINPVMVNLFMSIDNSFNVHNNVFKTIDKYDEGFRKAVLNLEPSGTGKILPEYPVSINYAGILKIRIKCSRILHDKIIIVTENITDILKITEEKQKIETELDNQKNRLAKIGQVIRTVIHDLRNPLSNIQTISDMVELASIEEAKEMLVENIPSILSEINGIINDMLDYTRADLPKIKKMDVKLISIKLKMKFELMEKQSGVSISYNCSDDFEINCDESKLLRVFSNITGNAVKALISHDIKEPSIEVTMEKDEEFIRIVIRDNGDGIPPELIDVLFEPFAFKSGYVGNGIGLPIVKNIIEMHKGTIDVKSDKSGTVFTILIPFNQS